MAVCIVQCMSGFWIWHLHICPAQQEDEVGDRGKTRARYILGSTVGGQTLSVAGGRGMGAEARHLVWVWCSSSWKASGGETVNTSHSLDAQRQTEARGSTAGLLWVTEEFLYIYNVIMRLLQTRWLFLEIRVNFTRSCASKLFCCWHITRAKVTPEHLWRWHAFLITF